ncbi:E3 ubiquitin-protein ligase SHPRH [Culicoides brevitarsis]|uniref:E3 ubiquitin-protein ligase SHPRH n=1 Tax=Culicoides brevitarsis TaxID=469753 RepID=UPI00307C51AC
MNENPPLLYCLLDLGIKIDKTAKDSHDFVFTYKKECFIAGSHEKLIVAKEIISDTAKLNEFHLDVRTDVSDPHTEYLSLFFNPSEGLQHFSSTQKERMVAKTFQTVKNDEGKWLESQISMEIDDDSRNEAQILYERLKRAHEPASNEDLNYLQHDDLHPKLRPYQLRAVKWMINRECVPDFVEIPFIELKTERFPDVTFFMDRFTMRITDYQPKMRQIPAGGLLCDEMGLGKTVEMLSLILHRRRNGEFSSPQFDKSEKYHEKFVVKSNSVTTHCICFKTSTRAKLILCQKCKTAQHLDCVMQHATFRKTFDDYECPDCWKKSGKIVESKATLIVSPLSIKYQWYSEIKRHIKAHRGFRVFIYEGVKKSGWISPQELASYDVVLTDYNVLSSEIYFTKITERQLRRPSLCAKPVSPLPMIKWYRTCLDEAQMVEIPTNQCARMVNSLPAMHRWAVTGTPIERHVSTLYGLIFFLAYDPFNKLSVWNFYLRQYNEGNYGPLIKILQKVMWRTCKVDVMDEIAIPPQSEVVHYVEMSDLQRFFYRNEHSQFRDVFHEKAAKMSGSLTSGMSTHMMKVLMEPLRKLRQDCTVPSIFSRSANFDTAKKLLTPTELNIHMIKNTEIELKTCLRTISSSLNGLAACHIMRKDYKSAINSYQSVLKWAADYNDKKIHVDTLLQIHAVHNMLDIAKHLPPEENFNRPQYEAKLAELEWKYIETYKNTVKEVEDRLLNVQHDLREMPIKELSNKGNAWWLYALHETPHKDAILEKITLDMKDVGMNFEPKTLHAVDYHLATWIDKVNSARREIKKKFQDLAYFHANLKPKSKLTEDELFKIAYLVGTAYDCHLFVNFVEVEDDEERPEPKRTCQMCRTKAKLDEYECLIFNKHQFGDNEVRGSWNPCEQEYILKTLFAFAKRNRFTRDILEAADTELKFLEGIKNEFKEYSQYWVEINYTVSAYDELNMCKSRLEDVDMMDEDLPADLDVRKSNMRIPRHMILEVQNEMQMEKASAENNFIRIKGRLKYLEHLKGNQKPDVCPICKQDPEERYAVLQCGHSLCMICVNSMAKFQKNRLSCALCRHVQAFRDVFYVTLTAKDCEVVGNFSAKILAITKEILKIRHEDKNVKIVIFSQWENILTMITSALQTNKIDFVMHTNTGNRGAKSHIEIFKTGPQTCLLMPLAAGSKGLNLTEATHVFLVEPILNPSEELQAIGRVHRIGQTKPTFVHRFIMKNTIEETIFETVTNDKSDKWKSKDLTVEDLKKLFELRSESADFQ